MTRFGCIFLCATLCAATEPETGFSLFRDLELTHGFRLSAIRSSCSPVEVGHILVTDPSQDPQWRLAQWGTRFSLESARGDTDTETVRILGNEGKTVSVFPGGLAGDGIMLTVNGGAEYDGELRQHGEEWPHLLIEHTFAPTTLHLLDHLRFCVAFNVERCTSATDKKLDPSLHTAHITAFWTIHNKNTDSEDYNDMIWFGIPLFDARYEIPRGHQAIDQGQENATNKFICTMEGTRFFEQPVKQEQWHAISRDILPLIREALHAAQHQHFLTHTQFEDLAVTSFNLGWEVPGPYDCAIHLRDLQLTGVLTNK